MCPLKLIILDVHIVVMKRDPGVVSVGDLDPGVLVLESLSQQLTWNKQVIAAS